MIRAVACKRDTLKSAEFAVLCRTPVAAGARWMRGKDTLHGDHGNREKERGIFFQEYDYERSLNDGDTNIVDPSMPGDTEYSQWVLYRALSVWILRSQTLCLYISPILRLWLSVPVLCSLLILMGGDG